MISTVKKYKHGTACGMFLLALVLIFSFGVIISANAETNIVGVYATGNVNGGSGAVGYNNSSGGNVTAEGVLWDSDTTGSFSDALVVSDGQGGGFTTTEMTTASTYIDAGFGIDDYVMQGTTGPPRPIFPYFDQDEDEIRIEFIFEDGMYPGLESFPVDIVLEPEDDPPIQSTP